jgi:hypothetical protein
MENGGTNGLHSGSYALEHLKLSNVVGEWWMWSDVLFLCHCSHCKINCCPTVVTFGFLYPL